ncbi:MAG: hypothetical protein ACE5DL_03890 [Nitrosopumilaceae archaeon]
MVLILGMVYLDQKSYANPFFSNGYFTENGIEWCEENLPLYEILGEGFFEHHKHSLESRICASLYQDYFWNYDGPDRVEKLIEKSRHYSQLEIWESFEESETGVIDTTPAGSKDRTLVSGTLESGEMIVQIIASKPKANQSMEINLFFLDDKKVLMSNVNYGIKIKQQGQEILENKNIFSEKGLSTLITRPLDSEEPVVLDISINGIGNPEIPEEWTGPQGELIMFTIVPEFGTIAMAIFGLTIIAVIIFSKVNKTISFNQKII